MDNPNETIVNRIAESDLVQFDLQDLFVTGERVLFDLKGFLFEELILKEKDFRAQVKDHDWKFYENKFVAITCTADAIVPTWAYMLVASYLQPFAKKIAFGDLNKLEEEIFQEQISRINLNEYAEKRITIKGCSDIYVPPSAYVELTALLRPVAKSIMYGEACSTVPVYKKKE